MEPVDLIGPAIIGLFLIYFKYGATVSRPITQTYGRTTMSNSIIYAVAELKELGSFNTPDLARELKDEHRIYIEQDHGHGCYDMSGNYLDELYENAVNEELGGGDFTTTSYNITFETP